MASEARPSLPVCPRDCCLLFAQRETFAFSMGAPVYDQPHTDSPAVTYPFHNGNAGDDGDGVGLVGVVSGLNEVDAELRPSMGNCCVSLTMAGG